MPFDIITCGSATVDFFIHTKQEPLDLRMPKSQEHLLCYPLGAKLLVDSLNHKIGGGGTNTAVSFAKLGFRTGYVGSIGKDKYGDMVRKALREVKVTFLGMRGTQDTDCSFILDSSGHDRTILVYRSASSELRFGALPSAKLRAKWFYFSSLMGDAIKGMEQLAAFAKMRKAHVAFNPSEYLVRNGPADIHRMLRCTDVLILNRTEAELLTGKQVPIDTLLRDLQRLGPSIVVITDGKHGTHAADNQHLYYAKAHDIKVVEATGAGDAFASAFVAGLAKTGSIVFALELGTTNAESCIQRIGAKEGLLTWKQALSAMHHQPVDVRKSV